MTKLFCDNCEKEIKKNDGGGYSTHVPIEVGLVKATLILQIHSSPENPIPLVLCIHCFNAYFLMAVQTLQKNKNR